MAASHRSHRRTAAAACCALISIAVLAAASLPVAGAVTRTMLASSGKHMTCGHKARSRAFLDARQADLDLFNSRLAVSANLSAADGARFAQLAAMAAPVTTVPIYFHILRANTRLSGGNVPRKWVSDQVAALNRHYSQAKYKFVLTGLDYTTNYNWFRMGPGSSAELQAKKKLKKGGLKTLNVYTGKYSDTLGGWAYIPDELRYQPSTLDGIVIAYDTMPGGNLVYHSEGKTLTHEVGHWLGLLHTFNPALSSAGVNLGGCVGNGDYVSDTPAERSPNFDGCPAKTQRNTCGSAGVDPVRNFMDYSVDQCRNQFTAGQRSRMHSMYKRYRASGTGYGSQGSNNAGGGGSGGTDIPPGGIPPGCTSCKCYPKEGYCVCNCANQLQVLPSS